MSRTSAADLTQLISQARAGSQDALGQLLELYRSYLRLIVSLQIGEKLQAKVSPSDIVQATFLQAGKGFTAFRGNSEGELMSWLRNILASQLVTELRRYATYQRDVNRERQLHVQVDQSSVLLNGLAAGGASPSHSAMRRERAVLLADALAQLPEDYRKIIVQRHLKGSSFADIARSTDRSVDSVKSAWRRGIKKLRESLRNGAF